MAGPTYRIEYVLEVCRGSREEGVGRTFDDCFVWSYRIIYHGHLDIIITTATIATIILTSSSY